MSTGKSLADMEKFFEWVSLKGLIPSAKVQYLASAARVVFSILDQNESDDLTAIDFESVFQRFTNLNPQGYTPDSLKAYRLRSRTALLEFTSWLSSPINYKPNTASKATKAAAKGNSTETTKKSKKQIAPVNHQAVKPLLPLPLGINTHTIVIPLKDVTIQVLNVPFNLSTSDAKKISGIISAYAVSGGE